MAKDEKKKVPDRIEVGGISSKLTAECFNCGKPVADDRRCYGCDEHVCEQCDVHKPTLTGHSPEAHLNKETTA